MTISSQIIYSTKFLLTMYAHKVIKNRICSSLLTREISLFKNPGGTLCVKYFSTRLNLKYLFELITNSGILLKQ